MTSYPVEVRRCRHIKTNGTQCGSPAIKGKELCYYHTNNRPQPVELYLDGERYCDSQIVLPVFEDAYSIQTVIRQVVQLMLTRRIARKDAGLLLYALQIASGNLKTMQAEKAKPTQVVVEPEKAGETPLGMTPWSASGQGHDPDEADGEETEGEENQAQNAPARPPSAEAIYDAMTHDEKSAMTGGLLEQGLIRPEEWKEFVDHDGPDPLLKGLARLCEARDRDNQSESRQTTPTNTKDQPLPDGTIQASQERSFSVVRSKKGIKRGKTGTRTTRKQCSLVTSKSIASL